MGRLFCAERQPESCRLERRDYVSPFSTFVADHLWREGLSLHRIGQIKFYIFISADFN